MSHVKTPHQKAVGGISSPNPTVGGMQTLAELWNGSVHGCERSVRHRHVGHGDQRGKSKAVGGLLTAYDDQLAAVTSLLTLHLGPAGHDASWEPLAEQIIATLGDTIARQITDEQER